MTTPIPRRDFFSSAADGLYGTALAYLFGRELYGGSGLLAADSHAAAAPRLYDLTPKQPHARPRARAIIQLFMQGGPSQVDLFDPKPKLGQAQAGTGPSWAGPRPGLALDWELGLESATCLRCFFLEKLWSRLCTATISAPVPLPPAWA